jgi:short-chain fatty acids transporter
VSEATGVNARPGPTQDGVLVRMAITFTTWAERWFPDAFIFVAIAVVVVSLAALANGVAPLAISRAFGEGFWSLILFTMQMAFVVIGGYVVASSAPAQSSFAALPHSRGPASPLSALWQPWPCWHHCSIGA